MTRTKRNLLAAVLGAMGMCSMFAFSAFDMRTAPTPVMAGLVVTVLLLGLSFGLWENKDGELADDPEEIDPNSIDGKFKALNDLLYYIWFKDIHGIHTISPELTSSARVIEMSTMLSSTREAWIRLELLQEEGLLVFHSDGESKSLPLERERTYTLITHPATRASFKIRVDSNLAVEVTDSSILSVRHRELLSFSDNSFKRLRNQFPDAIVSVFIDSKKDTYKFSQISLTATVSGEAMHGLVVDTPPVSDDETPKQTIITTEPDWGERFENKTVIPLHCVSELNIQMPEDNLRLYVNPHPSVSAFIQR